MRAKAYINTVGGQVLVGCYPMKIGYIEGFLHKGHEDDTWSFREFTTGKRVTGFHSTREACIERANELVNSYTEEFYRSCLLGEPVINTTYQDYVPMIGDVVRIVKPENPIGWSGSMEQYIGRTEKVERLLTYRTAGAVEVENINCIFDFLDGDFIPVTALEREFVNEPVLEAPATLSPAVNGFIVEGGRTLPDWMVALGRKLTKLTGIVWKNDFTSSHAEPQICCDGFILYGTYNRYEIYKRDDTRVNLSGANEEGVIDFLSIHLNLPKKSPITVSNEVVFSSSFLDFLHSVKEESRIARIILSVRELQYNGVGSLVTNVLTASEVNYLTYRGDNGNISYLPKGKEHKVTPDGKWARDGRQDGKAGKVMRKIFTKSALKLFKETDFEIFNNKFKARFEDGLKFDVLPNSNIPDVYLTDNRSDDGSLGSSCMRDVDPDYFDIYTNCDKLSIVTLTDKNGVLQGRALLWDVEIDGQDVKFIDRFYVSKDSYYDKFVEFASEKGYWRKKYYKTYDNKTLLVSPDGTEREVKLKIKTRTDFENYPYIDTFTYGEDGTLTNYEGTYTYNNTDGTRDGDGVYDELDDRYIDEDEAVTLYDGRVTHQNNAICVTAGRRRYIDSYFPASECFRCGDEFYHEDDVNRC